MRTGRRMRVGVVLPELPFPADTGGRMTLLRRIEYLNGIGCELELFVLSKGRVATSDAEALGRLCCRLNVYERSGLVWETVAGLLSGLPYAVANRRSTALARDLEESSRGMSLLLVEFPQTLDNVARRIEGLVPTVLEQHNCEWETSRSLAGAVRGRPLERVARELEWRRLRRYEAGLYARHDLAGMTFVTEGDMLARAGCAHCATRAVLPGGDDYGSAWRPAGHRVSFVANFGYGPNAEGALWLVEEVFPRVLNSVPDAELYLVGKDPTRWMEERGADLPWLHVTGRVRDLSAHYRDSALIAIPIFSGGGVKMKALEASSSMRPIIGTPPAFAGTGMDGLGLVEVEEDAASFAAKAADMLLRPERYLGMAAACRDRFLAEWSWEAADRRWGDFVLGLARP